MTPGPEAVRVQSDMQVRDSAPGTGPWRALSQAQLLFFLQEAALLWVGSRVGEAGEKVRQFMEGLAAIGRSCSSVPPAVV